MQIITMASEGYTDKEIACKLGLSGGTLRTYWDRLRNRYEARSRTELIAKALYKCSHSQFTELMVQRLPFYIWRTNEEGILQFCNEWFRNQLQSDRTTLLGRKFCEVLGLSAEGPHDGIFQPGPDGLSREMLCELPTSDGPVRSHKVQMIPLKELDGSAGGWIGYARELAGNADAQMIKFLQTNFT
jgi:DNA-binding CsgD family transcriptional regulator